MRRLAPRLLTCAWLLAGAAQAHPYTIEDLLSRQSLGPVTLSPGQRWLVVQTTDPYRTISRFDLSYESDKTVSRLDVVEVRAGGPPRRLFAQASDYGYLSGPYSPSGEKMAVTRVRGHDMELGIVTLASGQAVWTGLTPTANFFGRTLQWRSEDELVAVARDPAAPSFTPIYQWQIQARLADKWRATMTGELGLTYVGSGRYLGQHAPITPRSVMRIDARSGQAAVLARGDVFDLQLSPDGSRLALLQAGEDVQPDPDQRANMAEPFRRYRLSILDMATGAAWSPCQACAFAVDLLSWSPSGSRLLVHGKPDAKPPSAARFWRIDLTERRMTPVETPDQAGAHDTNSNGLAIPRGQWMGEDPLVRSGTATPAPTPGQTTTDGAKPRRDWLRITAQGPVSLTHALPARADQLVAVDDRGAVFGDGQSLWRVDRDGRVLGKPVTARLAPPPGAPEGERLRINDRPAPAELVLAWPAAQGGAGVAGLARPPRSDPHTAPYVPADETVLASGVTPPVIAALRTSAKGVQSVVLRTADRAATAVTTLNAGLAEVDLAYAKPVTTPGPGGKRLTHWLYLPPSLPQGRKAPLVVIPYPGDVRPSAAEGLGPPGDEGYPNPQILAAAGYGVLLPSLPTDLSREPMEGTAERILAAVDAVVASGAPVDPDRLGLWGHSYGAYAALAAATQSPRFKAIIAAAASPDLFVAYERDNLAISLSPEAANPIFNASGWLETGQARMGVPPWRDPDLYVRNSPILYADKITAPVLLITSDFDGDAFGGRAMFNVLYRQAKDALLLNYHGEGHQMSSTANLRDLYARALAFLNDQLGEAKSAP